MSRDPTKSTFGEVPGPGFYRLEEAIGKQQDSRRSSRPQASFPTSSREQAAKVFAGATTLEFVCSPGPGAYDVKRSLGDAEDQARSSYSFGRRLGEQRVERLRPSTSFGPGPGEYASKQASTARASKFGLSERKSIAVDRLYPGPGMPAYPRSDGANPSYVGQMSSLGQSTSRPSSPAYSFGAGEKTVPRERVNTSVMSSTPHGKRIRKKPRRTNDEAPPKTRAAGRYSWLTGRVEKQPTKPAGVTLPRSNGYSDPPKFSFGREDRFSENIFMPHKPQPRTTETPGPIYDVAVQGNAPQYSFPKVSLDVRPSRTCDMPGPGAYNIRLEHRMEELLRDSQGRPATTDHLAQLAATANDEPRPRTHPAGLSGAAAEAIELGLKFGDTPTRPTSPTYSFGLGDRASRAKCYTAGELNKEMTGGASPGPNTAHPGLPAAATSRWRVAPTFSFGGKNVARNDVVKPAADVGPAQFGRFDAVGYQAVSTLSTSPRFGFSRASRASIDKHFTPNDSPPHIPSLAPPSVVPGPIYFAQSSVGVSSFGRQPASPKKTEPKSVFGKAIRDKHSKIFMPQPAVPPSTVDDCTFYEDDEHTM